jgi:hypothetical protein
LSVCGCCNQSSRHEGQFGHWFSPHGDRSQARLPGPSAVNVHNYFITRNHRSVSASSAKASPASGLRPQSAASTILKQSDCFAVAIPFEGIPTWLNPAPAPDVRIPAISPTLTTVWRPHAPAIAQPSRKGDQIDLRAKRHNLGISRPRRESVYQKRNRARQILHGGVGDQF